MAITDIVFFGSGEYSLSALSEIVKSKKLNISLVITTKNSGIIASFAQENNLSTAVWESAKTITDELVSIAPRIGILASFGKIIPNEILQAFPNGILNIHPSLLPEYRGPSPVPTTILNGDKTTGVSIIKMDNKIDHGPILTQSKTEIMPDENSRELLLRLFRLGARKLTDILPDYLAGEIAPRSQDEKSATYTHKFTREDGRLTSTQSPETQYRLIRAMQPWPGAWTKIEIKNQKSKIKIIRRLKIHKAHLENGKLVLDEVQLEGKKPVTWKQFTEGYPGTRLV